MTQYLLSIDQPDGPPPPPEQLGTVMQNMATLTEEARSAGLWVLGGGLHPADMATVVRHSRAGRIVTDGPFIEGKEHLGGGLDHQGAAPRRRARVGGAARARDQPPR